MSKTSPPNVFSRVDSAVGSEPAAPSPPAALSAAERKALKARAHPLEPIVRIGNHGLTDAVVAEIDRALASHELVKIRANAERTERETLLIAICLRSGAQPVQHIGKILVVYRPRPPEIAPPPPTKRPAKPGSFRKPFAGKPGGKTPFAKQPFGRSPARSPARSPFAKNPFAKAAFGRPTATSARPAFGAARRNDPDDQPGPAPRPGRAPRSTPRARPVVRRGRPSK